MTKREVNISCGLCERPVTGVHYLWDNNASSETTIWFHGDGEEDADQCFMSKASKSLIKDIDDDHEAIRQMENSYLTEE